MHTLQMVAQSTTNTRGVSELFARYGLPEFSVKRKKQKQFISFMMSGSIQNQKLIQDNGKPSGLLRYLCSQASFTEVHLKRGKKFKKAWDSSVGYAVTSSKLDYISVDELSAAAAALKGIWTHSKKMSLVGRKNMVRLPSLEL